MSFDGYIDWTWGLNGSMCNEILAAVGQDGKHYVTATHDFPPGTPRTTYLGCVETSNPYSQVITETADVDATVVLQTLLNSLVGAPPAGQTWLSGMAVTLPGTDRLLCLSWSDAGVLGDNPKHQAWVWFEIVDEATINPVAYGRKVCGVASSTGRTEDGTIGSNFGASAGWPIHGVSEVINGNVYLVMNTGQDHLFSNSRKTHLIEIPYDGVHIDTSAASWASHLTELPFIPAFFEVANFSHNRANTQRAGVYDMGDDESVGVLCYLSRYEGLANGDSDAILRHTKVNYVTHTNDGISDVSAIFGIPFSDTQLNFAGGLSTDPRNDYWGPIIIGSDAFFARPYSDNITHAQYRQFTIPDGGVTNGLTVGQISSSEFFSSYPIGLSDVPRGLHLYSSGGDLFAMIHFSTLYVFGTAGRYPTTNNPVEGGEPEIPLPDPIHLVDGGREPTLRQRLINMYSEPTPKGPSKFSRYQRPGLYTVAVRGVGPIRCTFLWNEYRITVSGNKVYRDSFEIGELLSSSGLVRFAYSDDEVVLVAGGKAWLVTLTSVAQISDTDLPDDVVDVVFLAGRFVYAVDGTMEFFWSALNDAGSIDGTAFATAAENTADKLVGMAILVDQLVFFTTKVIEWWYPQDDAEAPYKRSPGRKNDQGLASKDTTVLVDNALFFLGYDKIVYRTGAVPIRVSTFEVEDWMRRATIEELEGAYAWTVVFGGHTFYVLYIPGFGTWAFDVAMKEWAEWKSWGKDRFRVFCAEANFLGDFYTGTIMGFDGARWTDLNNDDLDAGADPIERITSMFIPLGAGSLPHFNMVLNCIRGVGLATGYGEDPKVEMRFSDDEAHTWSNWMEADLGGEGERSDAAKAIWYKLGAIRSPGRAVEFRCTDPVKWSPYQVTYNQARP